MKDHNTEEKVGASTYVLRPRRAAQSCPPQQPKATPATVSTTPQKQSQDLNNNVWKAAKGSKPPSLTAINPSGLNSGNVVFRLHHAALNTSHINKLKQAMVRPYIQQLGNFRIQSTASPFDRRVTALEWHPRLPKTLAVASKSGDLVLWNYENTAKFDFRKGVGKGGSVTAMTFDLEDPSGIYTSSIDGTVCRQCITGQQTHHMFLHTGDYNHWYCSMDVNYSRNLLLAGDNFGNLTMMDRNRHGEKPLWTRRLHKSKATHCEFNRRCDWLLATASTDKTVKLWDLRMMSDRKSALFILPHERPINSAYFSPDSTRLLTTDQYGELRIYAAPLWDRMERSIPHPHRFFQHLTPIKATWHPLHDLVVVGRYPDDKFPGNQPSERRTIDIFDANSGDLVHQLLDRSATGIVSLNKFSPLGDSLASGMGYNILIWTDVVQLELIRSEKLRRLHRANGPDVNGSPATFVPSPSSVHRRPRRRRRDDDDEDLIAMKQNLVGKMTKR